MKNLFKLSLIAVTLSLATMTAKAQTTPAANPATFTSATNASGLDTVSNTGVKTQHIAIAGYWDIATIICKVTKISGTVGGSLALWGSIDGTNYILIGSAQTPSDASKQYEFDAGPTKFTDYQVIYTGASTMAASILSKIMYRRSQPTQRQF